MSNADSAFIKRMQNGWLVRLGLAADIYFPDLKSAIHHAGAGLGDSGNSSSTWLSTGGPRDEVLDKLEEELADILVGNASAWGFEDPVCDVDQVVSTMIRRAGKTFPEALVSAVAGKVREKLTVKRLLEAKSGDERPRKRKKGGVSHDGSGNGSQQR